MPSTSKKQHKLMEIAAHTKGGYGGVPQSVGKDFAKADDKSGIMKTHNGKPIKKKGTAETLYKDSPKISH
jgi:hypothetical protein